MQASRRMQIMLKQFSGANRRAQPLCQGWMAPFRLHQPLLRLPSYSAHTVAGERGHTRAATLLGTAGELRRHGLEAKPASSCLASKPPLSRGLTRPVAVLRAKPNRHKEQRVGSSASQAPFTHPWSRSLQVCGEWGKKGTG